MTPRVVWRPAARDDLFSIYDWIAERAGAGVAYDYTAAIEARTADLHLFPHRGAARPDLGAGIRTLSHHRRTVIAYRVTSAGVEIVALAHGGRDLSGVLEPEGE